MSAELIRIWLCDCGRVHVETRHCRKSYTPAEFLDCLRKAAGTGGAEAIPPRTSRLNQACDTKPALCAARQLIGVKAA
jgi:hypothetical protein